MEVTSESRGNVIATAEQENSDGGGSGGGCRNGSLLTAEVVDAGMMPGHPKGTHGKK